MTVKYSMIPVYFLFSGMIMILLCNPIDFLLGVSLGTSFIAIGMFIMLIQYTKRVKVHYDFIILMLLAFATLISMIVNWAFSYYYLVKFIVFMELPLFLLCIRTVDSNIIKKHLNRVFIILSIYFIILSFTDVAYSYSDSYGLVTINDLTLGYNNPNETAMYLYVCFSILLSLAFFNVKKKQTIINICLSVAMFYLICLTQSRACIIIAFATIVYTIFFRKYSLHSMFRKIIWLIPIGFPVITIVAQETLKKVHMLGTTIETGRYRIYLESLQSVSLLELFVGDFSIGFKNLHNAAVTVFCTIGLFGILFWVIFLYKNIEREYKKRQKNNIAAFSIYMIILHSSVESGLLLSGSAYAVLVFCLYFVAFGMQNESKSHTEIRMCSNESITN